VANLTAGRAISATQVTVSTGNLVIGTAGKGIDFSADNPDLIGMTSELLDDYEEGTWTPSVAFGGGSAGITYSSNLGYYTKVGNIVTVSAYISLSNKGTSTGSATLTGLPYSSASNAAAYAAVSLWFDAISYSGVIDGYCATGTTTIDLGQCAESGVSSAISNSNFVNNSRIMLGLTYRTA